MSIQTTIRFYSREMNNIGTYFILRKNVKICHIVQPEYQADERRAFQ